MDIPETPAQEVQPQETHTTSVGHRAKSLVREILETILLTVVIFVTVNSITGRFKIFGGSMDDTFHSGQYIIVNRLAYKFGAPERGDVIVFVPPGTPASTPVERILGLPGETDYIKRIVGVPGDTISIIGGQLSINGQVYEEPYIKELMRSFGDQVWVLGPDEYFALGDNRNASKDSRDPSVGPIKAESIVGRVWAVYWPLSDWQFVAHYRYK